MPCATDRSEHGILGGYVLVGCSVAGMAWSMLLAGDPDASVGLAVGVSLVVTAAVVFAYVLCRPLFHPRRRFTGTNGSVGRP